MSKQEKHCSTHASTIQWSRTCEIPLNTRNGMINHTRIPQHVRIVFVPLTYLSKLSFLCLQKLCICKHDICQRTYKSFWLFKKMCYVMNVSIYNTHALWRLQATSLLTFNMADCLTPFSRARNFYDVEYHSFYLLNVFTYWPFSLWRLIFTVLNICKCRLIRSYKATTPHKTPCFAKPYTTDYFWNNLPIFLWCPSVNFTCCKRSLQAFS